MNKRMKDKLVKILRFLIGTDGKVDKSHIPKLKCYAVILKEIAVKHCIDR